MLDLKEMSDWDKSPTYAEAIHAIQMSEYFCEDLSLFVAKYSRDLVTSKDPNPECTAIALRCIDTAASRFGFLAIVCSATAGRLRKYYSYEREETKSMFECSPFLAARLIDKLDRIGCRQSMDLHLGDDRDNPFEPPLGMGLEIYAAGPNQDEYCLKLVTEKEWTRRKIRRMGRRMEKLIVDLFENTGSWISKDSRMEFSRKHRDILAKRKR